MLSGLRHYTAAFTAIAVTAAQDVWEVNAASTKACWIKRCELFQYTDFGDSASEGLSLAWIQDYTSSGSGGSAVTPTPSGGIGAFSGTVERNNTTQASGGSPLTVGGSGWNVQAGYIFAPDPSGWIFVPATGRVVLAMTAPGDSITLNGTIWIVEAG